MNKVYLVWTMIEDSEQLQCIYSSYESALNYVNKEYGDYQTLVNLVLEEDRGPYGSWLYNDFLTISITEEVVED